MVTPYDNRTELNILVLNPDEEVIEWLDADYADITETSKVNECREIEITYPIDNYEVGTDVVHWYDAGNKIYIPATLGISSCLYVINTEYDLDFWKENTVTVKAEEVLTELNYDLVGFITAVTPAKTTDEQGNTITPEDPDEDKIPSGQMVEKTISDETGWAGTQIFKYKDKIEVTSEVLTRFFGYFYDIVAVDALDSEKKYISPTGTMSYMSLLRLIEEQTERVFVTDYISVDNKIQRRLSLRNYLNMRRTAKTETLDLNYNLDSLELNVSEENTYTAMAPEFTDNSSVVQANTSQSVIEVNSNLVNNANNASSNTDTSNTSQGTTTTTKTISEVITDWLNYEVEPRQEHPMIIQKDTAGNLVEVASWYAPFRKMKGQLHISSDRETESNYTCVTGYQGRATLQKCGKVSTSETIPQIIYNTLANSLLNKLSPEYELKIDVKDIQQLLGIPNLSYEIYETLQVRIPNFDYFVPCRITGTTKNPHKPGENKITVETDVKSMRNLKDTMITSNDMIINDNNLANIGGLLTSEYEGGLPDKLITINIKLVQPFDENTSPNNLVVQQAPTVVSVEAMEEQLQYDENKSYTFTHEEILEMLKWTHNFETDPNSYNNEKFNARTVTGEVVQLDGGMVWLIYYTHIQNYDINRWYADVEGYKKVFEGYYDKTTTITLYPREELNEKLEPLYAMMHSGFEGKQKAEYFKKYTFSCLYYHAKDLTAQGQNEGYVSKDITFDTIFVNMSSSPIEGGYCAPFSFEMALTHAGYFCPASRIIKGTGQKPDEGINNGLLLSANMSGNIWKIWGDPIIMPEDRTKIASYNISTSYINFATIKNRFSELVAKAKQHGGHFFSDVIWYLPVGVEYLKTKDYYDGLYSLAAYGGGNFHHAVAMINWKTVNGVDYVFIQDINFNLFAPMHWYNTSATLGWVKWSVIKNALDTDKYGHITTRGDGEVFTYMIYTTVPYQYTMASITESPTVNNEVGGGTIKIEPIDTSSTEYIFPAKEVQRGLNEVYTYYVEQGLKHDLDTITTTVHSLTGVAHNLKMKELRAIAYSFMLYYQNNNKTGSNIELMYGKGSDSMKYYSHFGGEYDYFTPCYPQTRSYEANYMLSSALFELGYLFSYVDWYKNVPGDVSFNDMMTEVNNKTDLACFIREASSNILNSVLTNQSRYKFKASVVLCYAFDSSLASSSSYNANRYPLLLYSLKDGTVYYYNLAGRGNSPSFNYNTKESDYGTRNPYGSTTITNLLTWIDNAKENNPNGNSILILSRYLQVGSI